MMEVRVEIEREEFCLRMSDCRIDKQVMSSLSLKDQKRYEKQQFLGKKWSM